MAAFAVSATRSTFAAIATTFKLAGRTLTVVTTGTTVAAAFKSARRALATFAVSATRSAFATIAATFKPAGRTLKIGRAHV